MAPRLEDLNDCEICRQHAELSRRRGDSVEVNCRLCGTYIISGTARYELQTGEWREKAWVLAAVTRNAWVSSREPLRLTTDNIPQLIADAPLPTTPVEVMDRILLDLAYMQRSDGGFSGAYTIPYDKHALYYLPGTSDLAYVLRGLQELGYATGFSERKESRLFLLELTVRGWERALELERATVRTWQAFVAMSFAPELRAAYDEGIKPALEDTGYNPIRVDQVQFNDKIDDRIVAELRLSGLVVADFTKHRGGVYFEAGFALGRGAPVIWCCREDDVENAHFDTRQFNHITWTDPAELRVKLSNRIRATLPFRDRARVR